MAKWLVLNTYVGFNFRSDIGKGEGKIVSAFTRALRVSFLTPCLTLYLEITQIHPKTKIFLKMWDTLKSFVLNASV